MKRTLWGGRRWLRHVLELSSRARVVVFLGVLVLVVTPILPSCSFITPEVGKYRGACKGSGAYAKPEGGIPPGQPDPRCTPDEDDEPCEVCEDTHCCGTRFGCYDDDHCACADEEFDECLEDIEDPVSDEGVAKTAQCWADFAKASALAKARVDCQREFCKVECSVP